MTLLLAALILVCDPVFETHRMAEHWYCIVGRCDCVEWDGDRERDSATYYYCQDDGTGCYEITPASDECTEEGCG